MHPFKEMKWNLILTSCLCIIAGVILAAFPEVTARTIAYALAIVLLVLGLFRTISYFASESTDFYRYDLVSALALLLAGVFILVRAEAIIAAVPFVIGFIVTISGILKLQNALNLWKAKMGNWIFILVLSLINIIFGVVLILNPFKAAVTLFMLLGIGLIYSGLSDLLTLFLVGRKMKALKDEE